MTAEISAHLAKASRAFGTLRSSVFSNRDLSVKTKVRVYSPVVLSTLLYGREAWAIKGEVKAKIKISPVVVFGVLSRMVLVRES